MTSFLLVFAYFLACTAGVAMGLHFVVLSLIMMMTSLGIMAVSVFKEHA